MSDNVRVYLMLRSERCDIFYHDHNGAEQSGSRAELKPEPDILMLDDPRTEWFEYLSESAARSTDAKYKNTWRMEKLVFQYLGSSRIDELKATTR